MKIKISKKSFLISLNIVKNALPTNTTFPIFSCILIDATKKEIVLLSSNTEISIKTKAEGIIEEKGIIAIEGNFLINVINTMPNNEEDIFITSDEKNNCMITCGNIEEKFMGKNPDDFPSLSSFSKDNCVIISEFILKKMIEKTIIAVSKNKKEENKNTKGIFIEVDKENILFRSMDNYRIAIIKQKLKDKYEKINSLVPGKTFEEVLKIIKGEIDKDVKIYFNENLIALEIEDTLILSTIIKEKYINVERLLNSEHNTRVIIDRKSLLESINRTKNYINRIDEKPVIFDIKENKIIIKFQSLNGEYKEEIKIKNTGKEVMTAFMQDHIYSILNVIEEDEINLYLNKSQDPMIIKDQKENYIYLILASSFSK